MRSVQVDYGKTIWYVEVSIRPTDFLAVVVSSKHEGIGLSGAGGSPSLALRRLAEKLDECSSATTNKESHEATPATSASDAAEPIVATPQPFVRSAQTSANTPKTGANARQVGGGHYKGVAIEHWDWCLAQPWGVGYMIGQITKYVERHQRKNGLQDLEKAQHFLDKLIEWTKQRLASGGVVSACTVLVGEEVSQSEVSRSVFAKIGRTENKM